MSPPFAQSRQRGRERPACSEIAPPEMREDISSLFTAKRDNSADDGAPVPKRDTERSHGNRYRGHIGPRPAIDNRKDKRQPPGIQDILLSAKWRPGVSRSTRTVPYATNPSWRRFCKLSDINGKNMENLIILTLICIAVRRDGRAKMN